MAAKIVKELKGFSGNQIFLMGKHGNFFVRKIGKIDRNIERMTALSAEFPVPKIVKFSKEAIDMEYIHGLDIKTFLKTNNYRILLNFIIKILDKFKADNIIKDYSKIYKQKLNEVELAEDIVFTKDELYEKLPKTLPSGQYHGDFTLENIIYSENKGFYLIDCVQIEYDSYIFDIAKMRQDLELGWFIRNEDYFEIQTKFIQQELLEKYPEAASNYILILMLLRVYKYTTRESFERNFLTQGINKLWK